MVGSLPVQAGKVGIFSRNRKRIAFSRALPQTLANKKRVYRLPLQLPRYSEAYIDFINQLFRKLFSGRSVGSQHGCQQRCK